MYNASLYGGIMGNFLLNELGEVLLEIQSHLDFGADMCLEVNENSQTAILKSLDKKFNIDFVHPELIMPLKSHRYLFVVERNNQFYAIKSRLAKVVFVE
jgi:hypothetical protein